MTSNLPPAAGPAAFILPTQIGGVILNLALDTKAGKGVIF